MIRSSDALARLIGPPNDLEYLLGRTYDERMAQTKRFGVQHHPMVYEGTFAKGVVRRRYATEEAAYKMLWEAQRQHDEITWDTVLLEEVYEALAETEPDKQIEELVQVAAVALAMAEDLMAQGEGQ